MHHHISLCCIALIILLLLGYLNFCQLRDSYQTQNDNSNNDNSNNDNSNNNNSNNNNSNNNNSNNNNTNNDEESDNEVEEEDSSNKITLADIYVAKNKMNYNIYQQQRKDALGNSNIKFGFSELPGTNPESIGFCPLGSYFKGDFGNNNEDVFTKCKPCFPCQKKPGYYVEGGCVGDKDVECKFGKVPYDIFLRAHQKKSLLHKQLPLHHKHEVNWHDNNKKKLSQDKHTHN